MSHYHQPKLGRASFPLPRIVFSSFNISAIPVLARTELSARVRTRAASGEIPNRSLGPTALEHSRVVLFVLGICSDCSRVYSRYSPQMAYWSCGAAAHPGTQQPTGKLRRKQTIAFPNKPVVAAARVFIFFI